jgi:septum formation protein
MRNVILASTSPRRKTLLAKMGVELTVVPSDFEEHLDDTRPPEIVAKELGFGKALAVAHRYPEAVVIGADQVVSLGKRQFAKPADAAEAREMFTLLASAPHKISTSVAVVCLAENIQRSAVAQAWVFLRPYNTATYESYIQTGDYVDKAGGYGVQNPAASPLIDHIEGDFDTVVGLPTRVLATLLQSVGVPATPVKPKVPPGLVVKKLQVG